MNYTTYTYPIPAAGQTPPSTDHVTTGKPGNNTNNYVLFNSEIAGPGGFLQRGEIARVSLSLYTTQAGTLNAYWKENNGNFGGPNTKTWKALNFNAGAGTESISAMTVGTDMIRRDFLVDDIDELRLIWTHGGTEIGTGSFIVMIHLHRQRMVGN